MLAIAPPLICSNYRHIASALLSSVFVPKFLALKCTVPKWLPLMCTVPKCLPLKRIVRKPSHKLTVLIQSQFFSSFLHLGNS